MENAKQGKLCLYFAVAPYWKEGHMWQGAHRTWEELRGKTTPRAAKPGAALHCWGGYCSSREDLGDHTHL